MKFIKLGLVILAGLGSANTIQSTQEAQEAPIPGYGVQDISWEAVLSPNGPAIRHLGTREEFLDKLLEADPTADRSDIYGGFAGRTRAPPDAGLSDQDSHGNSTNGTDTGLTKRDCPHYCFNYPETRCEYIQRGIDYLRHVPFQPTNGPGPGNCGRVNCSWNSAIWWCNDNPHPKTLTWDDIANTAQVIRNRCGCDEKGRTSGQVYHDDGWNVIVRKDRC